MRLALVCLLLIGCSADVEAPKPRPRAALEERAPKVQRFPVNGGEIVVLDVVSRDILGMLESQRCFVWRDAQYATSSLQCLPEDSGFPVGGRTADSPNP
jgi:hypothetical protein